MHLEFSLLGYKPQPWQAADTLPISAYMSRTLTNTWQNKFDRAIVETRVGYDRAKELFSVDAALDHFVVGDPNVPTTAPKEPPCRPTTTITMTMNPIPKP